MNSNTLTALLFGIDANRAAALTSAFHKLGYICRHTSVDEMGRMGSAIRDDKPDLVLFDEQGSAIELSHCLDAIASQQLDLPVIVLSDSESLMPDHQVADVLPPDRIERISRSCLREFWALYTRRNLKATEQELKAAETRSEQILSQSEEAIAYVSDGMIISSNRLFAEFCGFADPDDLDFQPIVDLIAEQDQDRLKVALRSISDGESSRVSVTVCRQDGEEAETGMKLAPSVVDGEQCVQITLRDEAGETSGSSVGAIDHTTGFASAMRFVQQLEDVTAHGLGGGGDGAFMLVSLDRYLELRNEVGIGGCGQIAADIAELLMSHFPKASYGRIDGDLFGIILNNISADDALKQAKKICKEAAGRVVTVDKLSINYTLSIGILPITKTKLAAAVDLLDNLVSVCEQIREETGDNGMGNGAALYVRARQQLDQKNDPMTLFEDARADNRLQLLFQPVVSLADEDRHYYEVTLSLKDQEADEISGEQLLRALESQGKSTELDRWIIVEATKQLTRSKQGGKPVSLIINLTCNVFRDRNLPSWLGVALKAAQLSPATLVLQFETTATTRMLKPAIAFSEQMRKLGAAVALKSDSAGGDDLQVIRQLNPLLTKLGASPKDSETLKEAITNLQEVGSKTVIQGVDSAATLATLWQLKPDYVQGSYVQAPSTELDYDFGDE
ncbi:PAS domain S-box-containing protein [Litorivivens lipolytica]|uniref:PAS domain S-box-containing protein n=1 Tax=Litorivivens lipolytica TaxID=1524264 RepID=A0A7W4Z6Q8_9GAMM|nr:GGDEF domain-containing protein [Litorivivens lipolytica]MBB3048543.1 PAS domain S-box-containing protein [Litorivivens lipolytica]